MTAYERTQIVVKVAGVVFALSFISLGVWDLLLIRRGQLGGNSASRVLLDYASTHPIWVFILGLMMGVLVGHFAWPQVRR